MIIISTYLPQRVSAWQEFLDTLNWWSKFIAPLFKATWRLNSNVYTF